MVCKTTALRVCQFDPGYSYIMEQNIKLGSFTNHGKVLFIDSISELVPDPLVKVSSTKLCLYRLSDLILVDKPQTEIDKEQKVKELIKEKSKLLKQIIEIEKEIIKINLNYICIL